MRERGRRPREGWSGRRGSPGQEVCLVRGRLSGTLDRSTVDRESRSSNQTSASTFRLSDVLVHSIFQTFIPASPRDGSRRPAIFRCSTILYCTNSNGRFSTTHVCSARKAAWIILFLFHFFFCFFFVFLSTVGETKVSDGLVTIEKLFYRHVLRETPTGTAKLCARGGVRGCVRAKPRHRVLAGGASGSRNRVIWVRRSCPASVRYARISNRARVLASRRTGIPCQGSQLTNV